MTRACVVLTLLAGVLAGCPDDPDKASTWTKKLSDPKESERAVAKLDDLGDPSAIDDLGALWREKKDGRVLQVIIGLAKPLTAKQAQDLFKADFETNGRPANWDKALPYLTEALTGVSEDSQRSTESAMKAAEALGDAQLGIDALVDVASRPVTKKLVGVQTSSIHAMGKFASKPDAKAKAAQALIKIIDRDPPPLPFSTADKEKQRALADDFTIYQKMTAASILALSELRVPDATKALVRVMYRAPSLFAQVRRALVASGPSAEDELRKILRGENQEINQLFKDKKLDKYCGDKNEHECVDVSAKDFYAAVVVGDFYDPKSVGDLLAALDHSKALPVAYVGDEPTGGTQYAAIFDALRKIGSAEGKDKIHAMWASKAGAAPKKAAPRGRGAAPAADGGGDEDNLQTRVLAIGAYAFIARDNSAAHELATIADSPGDNNLRQAAAEAFARLSTSSDDIKVLLRMAKTQFDASVKQKDVAAKEKPKADAADAELEKFKTAYNEANLKAAQIAHDPKASKEDKAKALADKKQSEADLKEARKKNRDATLPYKAANRAVSDLKSYGRLFVMHVARIAVAMKCKDNLDCYSKTLTAKPEDYMDTAVADVAPFLKDFKEDSLSDWGKDDKLGLVEAEVERSMLEIGKRGDKAQQYTDQLLDAAKSDDRIIRQSILLALPKIAKVPCPKCEQKLDVAVRAGAGKATLQELNVETTMLRNYFAWAGGNTPSTVQPGEEDAAPAPQAPPPPKKEKAADAEKKDDKGEAASKPAKSDAGSKPAKAAPAKSATPKKGKR